VELRSATAPAASTLGLQRVNVRAGSAPPERVNENARYLGYAGEAPGDPTARPLLVGGDARASAFWVAAGASLSLINSSYGATDAETRAIFPHLLGILDLASVGADISGLAFVPATPLCGWPFNYSPAAIAAGALPLECHVVRPPRSAICAIVPAAVLRALSTPAVAAIATAATLVALVLLGLAARAVLRARALAAATAYGRVAPPAKARKHSADEDGARDDDLRSA
jgi:hypothetical protein